jgi:hypothetical protein
MTQTPVAPAPAKYSSAPKIISIIVAAILSLCCCSLGILTLLGGSTLQTSGFTGSGTGTIPPLYGVVCIVAALVPWLIPLIVILILRNRK